MAVKVQKSSFVLSFVSGNAHLAYISALVLEGVTLGKLGEGYTGTLHYV